MLVKRMSDAAFHALKRGNFRVGTLAYYRKIEDEFRRDGTEGPAPVHFMAEDGVSQLFDASQFNQASGAVGGMIRMNEPFRLLLRGKGKLIMSTGLNVFVFCTTIENSPNPHLDLKFGAKKIHIPDPDAFSLAVAQKLVEEIIEIRRIKISANANSISHGHHPIVYQAKAPLKPEEVEDSRIDLAQVLIKEPQSYEEEHEHRFIWFPEDNTTNKLCNLPLNLDYLDLEFPAIWDHIKEA